MQGTEGYREEAATLIPRYEGLIFEDVHRETIHLFPAPPARVLDVGAGTGRDAAALARAGYSVTAVEPTPEFREAGRRLHPGLGLTWLDDGLPELARVSGPAGGFDLILLTAVWMHLDAASRAVAMARLARLVAPTGLIAMALRHGPVPPGRRMFDVSATETGALAERCALRLVHESRREDMQGRNDVTWTFVALAGPRWEDPLRR
ncbi:MAG TPA: class I SAM-dependent methyltransferase [Beijerinckiaceae bacterium]|jgi:SAM-dependent methyltransferase